MFVAGPALRVSSRGHLSAKEWSCSASDDSIEVRTVSASRRAWALGEPMPIPRMTLMATLGQPEFVAEKISDYNNGARTAGYNAQYNAFIVARAAGIAARGNLAPWLATPTAAMAIRELLNSFGMNVRNSTLVNVQTLLNTISRVLAARGESMPKARFVKEKDVVKEKDCAEVRE